VNVGRENCDIKLVYMEMHRIWYIYLADDCHYTISGLKAPVIPAGDEKPFLLGWLGGAPIDNDTHTIILY